MPRNFIVGAHSNVFSRTYRSPICLSVVAYIAINPTLPRQAVLSQAPFSTSACQFRRDRNKNRGISALRRTGPRKRQVFTVERKDLPEPVFDKARKSKVEVDPEHGLWQFFNKKRQIFATPEEDAAHGKEDRYHNIADTKMYVGRSWTMEELRHKSWKDLHKLWWICTKERNRLHTEAFERKRLKAGYGDNEADQRDKEV